MVKDIFKLRISGCRRVCQERPEVRKCGSAEGGKFGRREERKFGRREERKAGSEEVWKCGRGKEL